MNHLEDKYKKNYHDEDENHKIRCIIKKISYFISKINIME